MRQTGVDHQGQGQRLLERHHVVAVRAQEQALTPGAELALRVVVTSTGQGRPLVAAQGHKPFLHLQKQADKTLK